MDATENWQYTKRRRIYLLRHGDVSYFDEHGKPFRPATVPLNPQGQLQAEAAGRALADIPLDRAVASNLLRSTQTASLIIAGRALHVESCPELREIEPGRLADIPADAVEESFLRAFSTGIDRETCFLAGETIGSLVDRVLGTLRQLLADPGWQHLLLVAHGGVNRAILTHALGIDLHSFGAFEQDPGCINILDVDAAGRWLIRLVNYTPYNPSKKGIELTTMEGLYLQYRGRHSIGFGESSGRREELG
ncbi:MAG TPA: histidine phosphatase family protein [Gemmataceae bacterium]|nr:histidine phosphatase family protein [Gemmataceae bacterium]